MEELDPGTYLSEQDFFQLFKTQLKKDFEGSGINGDFTDNLLPDFHLLKEKLIQELYGVFKNSSQLAGLLYRVDNSEAQLKKYQVLSPDLNFEELIAELIIKRVLQKVVLKKRFSS